MRERDDAMSHVSILYVSFVPFTSISNDSSVMMVIALSIIRMTAHTEYLIKNQVLIFNSRSQCFLSRPRASAYLFISGSGSVFALSRRHFISINTLSFFFFSLSFTLLSELLDLIRPILPCSLVQ